MFWWKFRVSPEEKFAAFALAVIVTSANVWGVYRAVRHSSGEAALARAGAVHLATFDGGGDGIPVGLAAVSSGRPGRGPVAGGTGGTRDTPAPPRDEESPEAGRDGGRGSAGGRPPDAAALEGPEAGDRRLKPGGAGQSPAEAIFVHVAGAVKSPGVYALPSGSRVVDAVDEAGGPADDAEIHVLNLASPISDGERIYVPTKSEALSRAQVEGGAGMSLASPSGARVIGKLDINSADARAFEALPEVGPVLAARIVQFRKTNGRFRTIEELKEVPGIGDKVFAAIKDFVCVR